MWQALRFYESSNVVVTGITIQNSPKAHLKFNNCVAVQVSRITVWNSPSNSHNVVISSSDIACGNYILIRYSLKDI